MISVRLWIQHEGLGESFAVLKYHQFALEPEDLLHQYHMSQALPKGFDIFLTVERRGIASEILFPDEIRKSCLALSEETRKEYSEYISDIPVQATKLFLIGATCQNCDQAICDRVFHRSYGFCLLECLLLPPSCWYNFGENIFLSKEIRLARTDAMICVHVDVKKNLIQCCVKTHSNAMWSVPFTVQTKVMMKIFCKTPTKQLPTLFNLASVKIIRAQHVGRKSRVTQTNFRELLPKQIICSLQQVAHLSLRFFC